VDGTDDRASPSFVRIHSVLDDTRAVHGFFFCACNAYLYSPLLIPLISGSCSFFFFLFSLSRCLYPPVLSLLLLVFC
jgi:hypothetical protein